MSASRGSDTHPRREPLRPLRSARVAGGALADVTPATRVTVVCPRGHGARYRGPRRARRHRHTSLRACGRWRRRASTYAREYATALSRTAALVMRIGRDAPFDVVHACNPPDGLLLTAFAAPTAWRGVRLRPPRPRPGALHLPLRAARRPVPGDACSRNGSRSGWPTSCISTNESYRRVALERGGKRPEDVFVVRSAPEASCFEPPPPDPTLRSGKRVPARLSRRDGAAGRRRPRAARARVAPTTARRLARDLHRRR